MITFLVGALVACAIGVVIEGYFVIGRAQLLLNHAEQLLAVGAQLLAATPGKSAPHTDAPPDLQPRTWWQELRRLNAADSDEWRARFTFDDEGRRRHHDDTSLPVGPLPAGSD